MRKDPPVTPQAVDVGAHKADRVIDLVGHARRKLAYRCHFLGLQQLRLSLLEPCDQQRLGALFLFQQLVEVRQFELAGSGIGRIAYRQAHPRLPPSASCTGKKVQF